MFTGIIEAVGKVHNIENLSGDRRFLIDTGKMDVSDVYIGDSIAVNGVCLTVVSHDTSVFAADVSNETLSMTTLQNINIGSPVNLEKALLPTTRLGGHLVSGHVDGIGEVVSIKDDARSIRIDIKSPDNLKKYIAAKGSICVDGTSLTVNVVDDNIFSVNIVPHTQVKTVVQYYSTGTQVNLEVDLIARYLERLLRNTPEDQRKDINKDLLSRAGFI